MLDADTGGWLVANRTSDNEAVLRLQSKHRARLAEIRARLAATHEKGSALPPPPSKVQIPGLPSRPSTGGLINPAAGPMGTSPSPPTLPVRPSTVEGGSRMIRLPPSPPALPRPGSASSPLPPLFGGG